MEALMISQVMAIDDDNKSLKKMFAKLSMQNEPLKEAMGKNRKAILARGDGRGGGQAVALRRRAERLTSAIPTIAIAQK